MVEPPEHPLLHRPVQAIQVGDHPRFGDNLASDGDFQRVIMAVPVRVVALAEHPAVFRLRQRLRMQAMGGRKPVAAGQAHLRSISHTLSFVVH